MLEQRIAEVFDQYDPRVRLILREVVRLEQQYITDPLRTNSAALKEIRERIDEIVENTISRGDDKK